MLTYLGSWICRQGITIQRASWNFYPDVLRVESSFRLRGLQGITAIQSRSNELVA